jgi:hypothetical protein
LHLVSQHYLSTLYPLQASTSMKTFTVCYACISAVQPQAARTCGVNPNCQICRRTAECCLYTHSLSFTPVLSVRGQCCLSAGGKMPPVSTVQCLRYIRTRVLTTYMYRRMGHAKYEVCGLEASHMQEAYQPSRHVSIIVWRKGTACALSEMSAALMASWLLRSALVWSDQGFLCLCCSFARIV